MCIRDSTLPVSSNRFKKRVNDFKANGYESLISRKFTNQNRRKVTYDIERLLLSIDAQPEQPFNKMCIRDRSSF